MKREEAHTLLEVMAIELTGELANSERPVTERTKLLGKQLKAIDMAIEALKIDLVRCKECRFFKREECRYYIAHGIRRKPNDFCSYGKHKGGEDE